MMQFKIKNFRQNNINHEEVINDDLTKNGQDRKSIGRMPWHWEPKKDVVSCEKLRGAANKHRSVDVRMRKLTYGKPYVTYDEYIVMRGERGELKHLSTLRKRK